MKILQRLLCPQNEKSTSSLSDQYIEAAEAICTELKTTLWKGKILKIWQFAQKLLYGLFIVVFSSKTNSEINYSDPV